jgi:hypothetical protein|tara:strand:- start:53 stop:259 length:207 start_codon:yes stop_codon:yes gene_type:complete
MKTPEINKQLFVNWDTSDLLKHLAFVNNTLRTRTLPPLDRADINQRMRLQDLRGYIQAILEERGEENV